jgi:2-(1,2-epoxy-1,2-dihydrophenyl)acetyl-CoA isomerase
MDTVEIEQAGHVRYITLNRPEKMNALNDELAWSIVGAIREAATDDDTWVVGLTGAGRAFCSGLDLTSFGGGFSPKTAQTQLVDDTSWISHFLLDMRHVCDKPIVAGINGVAVGGGLALAMAADIRIMARGARLMAGYPRIGGSPDGGLSITLPQSMGYEKALRFLLENRTVEGDEALKLGMVSEVADDAAFPARFRDYCESLTHLSPITARLTKRGLARAVESIDYEAQLRYEITNIGRAFASKDGQEARKAFMEKRPAEFRGQ